MVKQKLARRAVKNRICKPLGKEKKHIPKILHLYWGLNLPLSYLRYLTVISWIRYNPDWQIIIGTPKVTSGISRHHDDKDMFYSGEDYFDKLRHIDNVTIQEFDWSGHQHIKTEVQRSDIYRWVQVPKYGGWWSDFDILYLKPMISIEHFTKPVMIVYHTKSTRKQHPIGFWGSPKNNRWIQNIGVRGDNRLKRNNKAMQGAGTEAIPTIIHKCNDYITPDIVYPFPWNGLEPMLNNKQYNLPSETIGIHWFGGAEVTKELEKQMLPDTDFDMSKNFHRIVKELSDGL